MQFRIHFDRKISPGLYRDYCEFLLDQVEETIKETINPLKYRVRERLVLESSVIKWIKMPDTIDLTYYVSNCLELVRDRGDYVIRVRNDQRVQGSRTQVKTLIRLLEYGNDKIPAYPVIRSVFKKYSLVYKDLLIEFIKERMLR